MFVLLFAFVFGGAIPLPGYGDPNAYREYLMPGIFAQTIAFAAATTAIGMMRRHRTRASSTASGRCRWRARRCSPGRTLADVIYNGGILIVLMLSGLVVGWTRQHRHPGRSSPASGCCSCSPSRCRGSASGSGLSVPTVEVAQQVSFIVIFPITFISNAFVPLAALPTWLQPIAEWNPISTLTASLPRAVGQPEPVRQGRQLPDPSTRSS